MHEQRVDADDDGGGAPSSARRRSCRSHLLPRRARAVVPHAEQRDGRRRGRPDAAAAGCIGSLEPSAHRVHAPAVSEEPVTGARRELSTIRRRRRRRRRAELVVVEAQHAFQPPDPDVRGSGFDVGLIYRRRSAGRRRLRRGRIGFGFQRPPSERRQVELVRVAREPAALLRAAHDVHLGARDDRAVLVPGGRGLRVRAAVVVEVRSRPSTGRQIAEARG